MDTTLGQNEQKEKRGFSCLQVAGILLAAVLITVLATLFVLKSWFFPAPFKPVALSSSEQTHLAEKLSLFESIAPEPRENGKSGIPQPESSAAKQIPKTNTIEPEAYSETDASREITFSERELNGLLANNTDLADKVAIDLAENLVSAKMLIPMDPDFPILGGKILRVRAGLELAYLENKPIVRIIGISFMGVPLPNAWMGGLKNIDLVKEFGQEKGFWHSFSEGVDSMQVGEGQITIVLKE